MKPYKYDSAVCPCGCGNVYEVLLRKIKGELVSVVRCSKTRQYYPLDVNEKNDVTSQTMRTKGYCEFKGYEVHRSIFIEPGEYIKINGHKFSFTAGKSWEIYTRFFRSIKAGEDNTEKHFPVPLTTNDVNQLKDDAYALFDKYIERQPAAKKVRNKQYEPFARFKIELL